MVFSMYMQADLRIHRVEHEIDDANLAPHLALTDGDVVSQSECNDKNVEAENHNINYEEDENAGTYFENDDDQQISRIEQYGEELDYDENMHGSDDENQEDDVAFLYEEDDELNDIRRFQCSQEHVNVEAQSDQRNSRRGKYRVEEPITENDDVVSVYYDSDDPPSYQSEIENEEAELVTDQISKEKGKCKHPTYNPTVESYELELGMLYEDGHQFKKAMTDYAIHFKRDICYYKNEPMRVMLKCAKGCPFHCTGSTSSSARPTNIRTSRGYGVYTDPLTGEAVFNPGMPSEQVIYPGQATRYGRHRSQN